MVMQATWLTRNWHVVRLSFKADVEPICGQIFGPIDDVFAKFFDVFSLDVSFLRSLARSNIFEKTACVAAIDLVRKSPKSDSSSRFFGRLKILDVHSSFEESIFRGIY